MDCNKNEAIQAKLIAEKMMESNDFDEARKIALKAYNLYPELENITQLLSICDVHSSAKNKDWYGILQVQKLADESIIRKQYRGLAFILHPDKNRFPGAESAFKIVSEANAFLLDPTKKALYDHKIKVTAVRSAPVNPPAHMKQKRQFNKQYEAAHNVSNGLSDLNRHRVAISNFFNKQKMFWTICSFCRVKYQYPRNLMEETLKCHYCTNSYTAHDIFAEGGVPLVPKSVPPNVDSVPEKSGVSERDETPLSREDMNKSETRNRKNKRRKKDRKQVVKSSESSDNESSSDSDIEEVTIMKDLNSGPSHLQFRRSSRKRQDVTYIVGDSDEDEHPKHDNHNGIVYPDSDIDKNAAKGNGKTDSIPVNVFDAIMIESDSDRDSNPKENPEKVIYNLEDPEFSDFDKDRDEKCFSVDQFWACYDSGDSMPRFYANVKEVSASPFELSITWLEATPTDETHRKWIEKGLPVGCGIFTLGVTEKVSSRLTFSHQLHCEEGEMINYFSIYPREGQVWALFKDWDLNWSSNPEDHKEYKYEAVEILTSFDADEGVRVCYLDKIKGFVYLFQRSNTDSFLVKPNELYRFSHSIPSYKMTGSEREGVPGGSFELDPAALPQNLDNLYYPGMTKMDPRAN